MTWIKTMVLAAALSVAPAAVSHAQVGGRGGGFAGGGMGMIGVPGAVGGGYYSPYGWGYTNPYGMGYTGGYGYGGSVVAGYPYVGYPGYYGGYYNYPQTVNTMGPLMQTIRRTTMQRRSR